MHRASIVGTILLLMLVFTGPIGAAEDVQAFSSEDKRQRFHALVAELRCPKCQNQTLADSNSPIAQDLRSEIYRMLEEGKTDRQIVDFLVDRYGEFVMYRPPVKKTTLILWLTPLLLAVLGIGILWWVYRRQSMNADLLNSRPGGVSATAASSEVLSAKEQAQLQTLLGESERSGSDDAKSSGGVER
ncbi:cytochrome c-type biogenesis protein [Porticoccus sp.]|uniref:cytochrome c-type biogenesis protein n=1 Tax=Porticoccus sp. TaxID=2024853 RepID=UPI003F696F00